MSNIADYEPKPKRVVTRLERALWLGVSLAILCIFASIMVPNFYRMRATNRHSSCVTNVKRIKVALELYAKEHDGTYPETIMDLYPKYLSYQPKCPSVGEDTYRLTITTDDQGGHSYLFVCQGSNHEDMDILGDYPRCSSKDGIDSHS